MAVIKCSNCENEILDNEVVCPYCDCPLSETIKKMKKEDLKSFSDKSVDELTGKIPVVPETSIKDEPKLGTSSDFEKEKAAILKDIGLKFDDIKEDRDPIKALGEDCDLDKTVKISKEEILGGKMKSQSTLGTAVKERSSSSSRASSAQRKRKTYKKNNYSKYIIIGVTVIGIILIAFLISKVTSSISDGINSRKKPNRTVEVKSSAESIEKMQGFRINVSTLEITDEKAMKNQDGKDFESVEEYPWYSHMDEIKHVTVYDGVTSIGPSAFEGYFKLQTVKLPDSVTLIDDKAFYNCSSLTEIKFHDAPELVEIGDSAFENCTKLETIAGYTKESNFDLELAAIGDKAFANCKAIKEFRLPDDITLGENVFKGHNSDFAIVCTPDSEAYDYATENDIPVKEEFEEGKVKDEITEEEEEEESQETTSTSSDEDSNDSQNTDNTSENKPTLEELQNQLAQATTDEEKNRILEQITNY